MVTGVLILISSYQVGHTQLHNLETQAHAEDAHGVVRPTRRKLSPLALTHSCTSTSTSTSDRRGSPSDPLDGRPVGRGGGSDRV